MKITTITNILMIVTVTVSPLSLAEKVYTWTDAEGLVHYSEKPPASGNAKVINIRTRSPAKKTAGLEDKQEEKQPVTVPTEEPSTLTLAQKRENCEKARKNLASLETRPRVLATDPETGEKRVLTHDEHANMIIKSREHVRKYCDS